MEVWSENKMAWTVAGIVILLLLIGIINLGINNQTANKENKALQQVVEQKNTDLIKLKQSYTSLNLENVRIESELQELNSLPLFNMNPTFRQVQGVLSMDHTNEKPYIDYEYDCVDYSTDLSNAFLNKKIHSCVTWVYFSADEGHALVAVNTSDYGIIYIEPQSDRIIYSLELGDDYCDKVNWDCVWKINKIKSCYQ